MFCLTRSFHLLESRANVKAAVAAACTDPPTLWTKNASLKEQLNGSVIAALAQLKEKDFDATIDALNTDQQDVLMKFIYKGLATGENPALFKLYGALFDKVGIGCVVRALAERRTV